MKRIEIYKLGHEREKLKLLYDISSLFTLGPRVEKILRILLEKIGRKIEVTYLAIWLINKDGWFELVTSYNMSKTYINYARSKEGRLRKDEGVVGRAYVTKKPVLVKNFNDGDFVPKKYTDFITSMGIHLAGLISFPLIAKGQVIGALNFYFPKPKKSMLQSEINFIAVIANQLANFILSSRSYQELMEEKNKTVSIISNFIDPVIVINQKGELALINPSAKKIFKISDKDLGKNIIDEKGIFSFDKLKTMTNVDIKAKIIEFNVNKQPIIEEVAINTQEKTDVNPNPFLAGATPNDESLIYKVLTAKVHDRRNEYGTMKIFNDLTREKTIDKMKSEFISIAAHQLRTPLTSIKWAIKMLLNGDVGILTKDQITLLAKGYNSNERMIILVNNMLNVSRIEEGKFGYTFEMTDINNILKEALMDVEKKISLKKIQLIFEKPDILPKIPVDKPKMILVLQNLLDNSVKYTPDNGKITIKIEKSQVYLKISITDNGVGIPNQDRAKLFSKFFRASNAVRMQTEGSGLGLFIVKKIIEEHGGKISCKSKEGIGTEFSFNLPLKR